MVVRDFAAEGAAQDDSAATLVLHAGIERARALDGAAVVDADVERAAGYRAGAVNGVVVAAVVERAAGDGAGSSVVYIVGECAASDGARSCLAALVVHGLVERAALDDAVVVYTRAERAIFVRDAALIGNAERVSGKREHVSRLKGEHIVLVRPPVARRIHGYAIGADLDGDGDWISRIRQRDAGCKRAGQNQCCNHSEQAFPHGDPLQER